MADLFFLTPRGDRLHSAPAPQPAQVKEVGGGGDGRGRGSGRAMRDIKAQRWSARSKSAAAVNHRRPLEITRTITVSCAFYRGNGGDVHLTTLVNY